MSYSSSILVAGSYATGLVMQTPRLPAKGETVIGHSFRAVHGGKGSNQAVQAARLGAETAFIACVGTDAYGDALMKLMQEEGVNTSGVQRHAVLPTGVGFIIVDDAGHNLIAVDLGANTALSPDDLEARRAHFESAAVVVAQLEIRVETALAAMRLGTSCGAKTILNPAPAHDLSDQDLSCVDIITPNETETLACAGMPNGDLVEAMHRLRALGCRNVVTTTGEAGCLWLDERASQPVAVPTCRVDVVDTVGAGDAFTAGLAVGLSEGMNMTDALRLGHAAAALSVTKADTIPSYHRRAKVDALLRGAKGAIR